MNEARELLRMAKVLLADKMDDKYGFTGRDVFNAVHKVLEKNSAYDDFTVEVDATPHWSGKYYPQTMTSPEEFPELELNIDDVRIEWSARPMSVLDVVFETMEELNADEELEPHDLLRDRMFMRTVDAAIKKWMFDLEDVEVEYGSHTIGALKTGQAFIRARRKGSKVEFYHDLEEEDLAEMVQKYGDDNYEDFIPEPDY